MPHEVAGLPVRSPKNLEGAESPGISEQSDEEAYLLRLPVRGCTMTRKLIVPGTTTLGSHPATAIGSASA